MGNYAIWLVNNCIPMTTSSQMPNFELMSYTAPLSFNFEPYMTRFHRKNMCWRTFSWWLKLLSSGISFAILEWFYLTVTQILNFYELLHTTSIVFFVFKALVVRYCFTGYLKPLQENMIKSWHFKKHCQLKNCLVVGNFRDNLVFRFQ